MQPMTLIGKNVSIGDIDSQKDICALELLQFFYPNHRIIQSYDYLPEGDKLIFVKGRSPGDDSVWRDRDDREVIFVNTTDDCQFDLTDRNQVLKLVFSKWGIDPEYILADDFESINRMGLMDFYNFIKPRWISKNLCVDDEVIARANVHGIIGKGFNEILRFADSITDENAPILEIGILKFIETARIKSQTKSKAYSKYNKLYRAFNSAYSDNDYIALTLAKYREMANNYRFKLIWLLSQFRFDTANVERYANNIGNVERMT